MPALLSRLSARFFSLMMLLLLLIPGCASLHPSEKAVWYSQGQFVNLVPQERLEGARIVGNQHPVFLSPAQLRPELAALRIKLPDSAQPTPLLGEGELENLSEQISAGLQQARSDQDLVFAVIGKTSYFKGVVTKDVVTTGRVFFRDNRLNLILGLAREPVKESDRRLQPFTPGSRQHEAHLPGRLTTISTTAAFVANRSDWITMAIPAGMAEQTLPQAIQPETKSATPVPASPVSATANREKSIEERLRFLGELRSKGLITEEEYRVKKESILKEL